MRASTNSCAEPTFSNLVYRFGLEGATATLNMQMLASHGYAVLYPEIPERLGTPMQDLVNGINTAVNKVIELGIADPNRLGIFGHSYGGYATISAITQTQRFKAAVMSGGFADLTSFFGQLGDKGTEGVSWTEDTGLMGGPPWEHAGRYVQNSPIYYIDRVTTPLLILHGGNDTTASIQHPNELFVGLQRLGRKVEYRKYVGEGHVIQGRENLLDYWNAVLRWFDKYLKPSPPDQSSSGTSSVSKPLAGRAGDSLEERPQQHPF